MNSNCLVNDASTSIFKSRKGVISTFKSMSHNVNVAFVEATVEA